MAKKAKTPNPKRKTPWAIKMWLQGRDKSSQIEDVGKQFKALVKVYGGCKMSHFLIFFKKNLLLLMKQDWFSQTCQDLWYMYWDYFSNHLWKADLGVKWLSLDKKVKGKLMELLYGLKQRRKEKIIMWMKFTTDSIWTTAWGTWVRHTHS